ncbi:MAG: Hsp70 family protein, partial [Candidatus Methanomethylophilaceae archaeon]|nr:Hsp70 family protein [Candidatus Methanomethylophilaceae archaeon]
MVRIGLDLGTTFSAISIYDGKSNPKLLKDIDGRVLTPSIVSFQNRGVMAGYNAYIKLLEGSPYCYTAFKTYMGSRDIEYCDDLGNKYSPEDLSQILVDHLLKKVRADYPGEKIEVVVTVPAYFDDVQRTQTINAVERCGVTVLRDVNEPTAAAYYYGFELDDRTTMVYDLGGGTFDVSIIKNVVKNGVREIEVVGTLGDHNLGGRDWDELIMNHACEKFVADCSSLDPRADEDPSVSERLLQ